MYAHAQSMNMTNQIGAVSVADDDDGSCGGVESIDNPHIRFEAHSIDDSGAVVGGVVEDITADAVYAHNGGVSSEMAIQRHDDTSQLTLSFRGQVYVFDSVTPDKVRCSLSLSLSLDFSLLCCLDTEKMWEKERN
jgi:hypothetical protein